MTGPAIPLPDLHVPPAAIPDHAAEIEERHRALRAAHVATWGEPGRGCGCAKCREPVPEPAFPGALIGALRRDMAASRRTSWVRANGVKQGKMREPGE